MGTKPPPPKPPPLDNPGDQTSGNQTSGNPPSSNSPSSSSGSSSGSSSPPVDPRIATLENLFTQAYIQLWGEPPTQAYVKQAATSGMNVTEFVHRERMKDAFQRTQTYKDEAKGIYAVLRQIAAV